MFTFDDHVIDIYLNVATDLVLENRIRHSLVSSTSIDQAKENYFEGINGLVCEERGFGNVFLCHSDLIIARECIHKA